MMPSDHPYRGGHDARSVRCRDVVLLVRRGPRERQVSEDMPFLGLLEIFEAPKKCMSGNTVGRGRGDDRRSGSLLRSTGIRQTVPYSQVGSTRVGRMALMSATASGQVEDLEDNEVVGFGPESFVIEVDVSFRGKVQIPEQRPHRRIRQRSCL